MTEYIINPRRAPRAHSRCAALVDAQGAAWSAETEDLSSLGCQLVAPSAMARGLPLKLVLADPKVKGSLRVEGRVAWGTSQPPWRVGVAFGEASRGDAERWFAALVAAHPGLAGLRKVPDRIPIDAMLYLGPPPTFLVDFTPEEVDVLRHVAGGTTVAVLRRRLAASWDFAQRAIFSLLARGLVTISRSAAAHVSAWRKVMSELGVEFVTETARQARGEPALVGVAPPGGAGVRSGLDVERERRFDPPPELSVSPPLPARSAAPTAVAPPVPAPVTAVPVTQAAAPAGAQAAAPAPGGLSAGTGWRGEFRHRSAAAQECFDLGRSELAAGRGHSALAHLRRALQLAPGDPEIASEIGRAMTAR